MNSGTVSNSSRHWTASPSPVANGGGTSNAGGLLGQNSGVVSNSTYASGQVSLQDATTGGSDYAGGLVGQNSGGGTVTGGYATGDVTVGAGSQPVAGGLVGNNSRRRSSASYATGDVSATASQKVSDATAGGLVGNLWWDHNGQLRHGRRLGDGLRPLAVATPPRVVWSASGNVE